MNNMEEFELYEKAKEAYYNGEEIMSDSEFDALEEKLGLSNGKSYVGSKHNPSYTIKHPVIMGSLNKVQIHEANNGLIRWRRYLNDINKVTKCIDRGTIYTPKYDGCSFEVKFNGKGIINASTRGDGEYGRDITKLISYLFKRDNISFRCDKDRLIRGEVLLKKEIYLSKYANEYKNPRSFVSGILNSDWTTDKDYINKVKDLDYVVYDYRVNIYGNKWKDLDFYRLDKVILNIEDHLPKLYFCKTSMDKTGFKDIYKRMERYRDEGPYTLDGFVIKPMEMYRHQAARPYPDDCLAVKFIPQTQPTTVVDIEWNLGKTGEYTPVVIVDPIIMDGKVITRASGHNYGCLISNNISIGTKIVLSLAGDIIPFIYKVVDTKKFSTSNLKLPSEYKIDGVHLMSVLNKIDRVENSFINSVITLNIPTIGEKKAKQIFEYIKSNNPEEFTKKVTHILLLKDSILFKALGGGKTGENGLKGLKNIINTITLSEIIQSCNFEGCGKVASDQIENMFLGLPYNLKGLASKSYTWALSKDSKEYRKLNKILIAIGRSFDSFIKEVPNNGLPFKHVILTGKPTQYKTKADFLKANPCYLETTNWKEAEILFTGDLNSNSAKMVRAKKEGIAISIY